MEELALQNIAYAPFFPLGGLRHCSHRLSTQPLPLKMMPMQVALAWLLQRAPNIMLIPGTSSVKHLRENLDAATLRLPPETIAALDSIAVRAAQ